MGEKGRVFTAARARLMINGVRVGYATNVSGGENIDYEEVAVLDNIEVEEHVPTRYRARLSAGFVRLVGETAKTLGHFPKNGANVEDHLKNILTNGTLKVAVEDNQTGKLIATFEQVRATSHNFSIDAGGLVGRSMEFVCLRLKDESEV